MLGDSILDNGADVNENNLMLAKPGVTCRISSACWPALPSSPYSH
jgi:hypothetical protein